MSELENRMTPRPISEALTDFGERLRPCWDWHVPDSFWACEAPLGALIQSDFLAELLESQLTAYLEFDALPVIQCGSSSYAQLGLPNGLQLDILYLEEGRSDRDLQSQPYNILLGFKSLDDRSFVEIELFEYPGQYRNEIYDPHTRLIPLGKTKLRGSSIQRVIAGRNAFRIAAVRGPVLLVLLKSPPAMDFSWTYDRESLTATVGMVPQMQAYRLYYAAKLLGQITRKKSIASLLALSHHSAHFVRWAALQSLFKVDFEAAVKRLKSATEDEHPSVSRAARQASERLSAG